MHTDVTVNNSDIGRRDRSAVMPASHSEAWPKRLTGSLNGGPFAFASQKIDAGRLDKTGQCPIDDDGALPSGVLNAPTVSWSVQMIGPRISR